MSLEDIYGWREMLVGFNMFQSMVFKDVQSYISIMLGKPYVG